MNRLLSHILIWLACLCANQISFAVDLRSAPVESLLHAAPVQEKVYLHLDNNCYFLGDTIWYKSYVVRADNHRYTDMSRLVYVELVSPDGLVVERQTLIATSQGMGDGNFVLRDSLYSGYYELRAYTRWMLNFCVTQHPHFAWDEEQFYSRRMAKDFFREFGTISRRVVPVFEKPERQGEYGYRFMKERPKRRLPAPAKPALIVKFYPEGGQLLADTPCRVAFEATNEQGQAVQISGIVTADGRSQEVATAFQGRGEFELRAPSHGKAKATFRYLGKDYHFELPSAVADGCALRLSHEADSVVADFTLRGAPAFDTLQMAVLCRGRLLSYQTLAPQGTTPYRLAFAKQNLTTGVNNLLILDAQGRPVADRLFFVNRHDYEGAAATMSGSTCRDLDPLQPVTMTFQAPADARHLSISVRDRKTDETTYDTGTMLTELLLSSELQGFVANPDFYFVDDSPARQQALDLLMMVQGWRRYDYQAMVGAEALRYVPEVSFTVEGVVGKTIDFEDDATLLYQNEFESEHQSMDSSLVVDATNSQINASSRPLYRHPSPLKREVEVKAELSLIDEVGEITVQTHDSGHFAFELPPFFGKAILFLRASKNADRQRKRDVSERFDEKAWPDYYVKRDLFYPVFAQPYSYYQCHLPDVDGDINDEYRYWLENASAKVRISAMDQVLDNVDVSALLRRGSRVQDLNHPVFTMDAYELFNLTCDYGLESGVFHYSDFSNDVSTLLFGSYDNSGRSPVVQRRLNADIDGEFRTGDEYYVGFEMQSYQSNYTRSLGMQLKRMDEVRVYTDFDLRNYDAPLERSAEIWDVLVKFVLFPNEGERRTYRDRRIQLSGIYMPADFYKPDYSRCPLPEGETDYRRTLYWNPNAQLDADGRCTITFYNNSTARNLHISVAGLTADGIPVTLEQ